MSDLKITPKILIYGNIEEFKSKTKDLNYELYGYINYINIPEEKFILNEKIYDKNDFIKYLNENKIDYIIHTDLSLDLEFHTYLNYILPAENKLSCVTISIRSFINIPHDLYYDVEIKKFLYNYLFNLNIKIFLDYDGYFLKIKTIKKFNNNMILDGIISKDSEFLKLKNIYDCIYENFQDIKNKFYDIALLIDRSLEKFKKDYDVLKNITNKIIIYTKINSDLDNYINNSDLIIEKELKTKIHRIVIINTKSSLKLSNPNINNNINNHNETFNNNDLVIYVVNHKNIKLLKLPDYYKEIDVGNNKSCNFAIRSNTGDNIDYLNIYLNELTALYWIWKNTDHYYIGLNHYRRFFSEYPEESFSYNKIISKERLLDLLKDNDIILGEEVNPISFNQYDLIEMTCLRRLSKICHNILRKHLIKSQPEYIDYFDFTFDYLPVYKCHLLITKREILNKYCEFLFSFIIDVTKEFLSVIKIEKLTFNQKRVISYLGERMLNVWLTKQNLKIKELPVLFNEHI